MAIYPDIPNVPGVPSIPRGGFPPPATPPFLTSDAPGLPRQSPRTQWGLFKDGSPALTADTVTAFDFRQEWDDTIYPQEEGQFATYNKVATPYDIVLTLAQGGSNSQRTEFLEALATIAPDTELYDVVIPEKTFTGVNIVRYAFSRRPDRGLNIIVVDVFLQEIRQTAEVEFTKTTTKSPSGAATKNTGTVPTKTPTVAQAAQAREAYVGVREVHVGVR